MFVKSKQKAALKREQVEYTAKLTQLFIHALSNADVSNVDM